MSEAEVQQILQSNDLYFILGVDKKATNAQLKTAFKKRALQFHPDKNRHRKAQDAFKRISAAFQVLSDAERRESYDQNPNQNPYSANRGQQYEGWYWANDDMFTAEDLFEFMFSNFGNTSFHQRQRPQQQRYQHQNAPWNPLVALMPFLFFIFALLFQNLTQEKPLYQFNKTKRFQQGVKTPKLGVVIYVDEKFNATDTHWQQRIIADAERQYFLNKRTECENEIHSQSYQRDQRNIYEGQACKEYFRVRNLLAQ